MTEEVQEPAVETFIMVDGTPQPAAMQPPQSELQGAFKMAGTASKPRIVIDMSAALTIAQDMVRHARSVAFAKNDAARAIAFDDDDADGKAYVRQQARKLKDAPADQRLIDASTPDDLLAAVEAVIADMGA